MQSDEVVWQIINHGHCSYKAKMQRQNFCRNEHNVTGLCNRSSCPLANSRYATIREDAGRLYLCIKTIERAHTPKHLWQKIRLSPKYMKALEQVNEHLAHWPKFLVHKNKQRLTKITQYMIRMRKLALKPRVAIITVPGKLKKKEARREAKALKAAQIERALEKELLTRLQQGTYGDIYNFPSMQYNKALDKVSEAETETEASGGAKAAQRAKAGGGSEGGAESGSEGEGSSGDEEEMEEEREQELELNYESDDGDVQYVEDLDESEDDDDIEDIGTRWASGGLAASSSDDDDGSDADGDDSDGNAGDSDGGADGDAAGGGAGPSRAARGGAVAGQRHKRERGGGVARSAKGAAKRRKGAEIEWEREEERVPAQLAKELA